VPFDAESAQAASDRAVLVIRATQAGELLDRVAKKPDRLALQDLQPPRPFCWSQD
jgi:hypothetical protein